MGDFSFFFRVDFFLFFSWAGGCSPSGVTFEDMTRKEGGAALMPLKPGEMGGGFKG